MTMTSTQRSGQQATSAAGGKLPPLQTVNKPHKVTTTITHSARPTAACTDYGHAKLLPDYKLLAIPHTNNYYAAVGGCPCIPRQAARPGSYRLRAAQLRSTTNEYRTHCRHTRSQKKQPTAADTHKQDGKEKEVTSNTNNTKSGQQRQGSECPGCAHGHYYAFGWRPGPHTVHAKNTAATGKCDTFGNLAFKSRRFAGITDNEEEDNVSEAGAEKLADLETLILDEHAARVRVEGDVVELKSIDMAGNAEEYKQEHELEQRQRRIAAATDADLDILLRDVRSIVDRPLHQVNMDLLRRLIRRHEQLQKKRDYLASLEKPRESGTHDNSSSSEAAVMSTAAP